MNAEEKAAEKRRLVVQASPPVELLFTSPVEFTLHAHEANTVLEVLEIRAEQIGLPKTAAAFLKMEVTDRSIDRCLMCSASMGCCAGTKEKEASKDDAGRLLPNTPTAALEASMAAIEDTMDATLDFSIDMEDPHKTLEEVLDESGLRGQAKVSVHGEDIVKVFAMFDHDSTTKISFRNLARVEGLGEDDEELQDIINRSDKDGDDEIDFDGFCRLMKKQGWQL